METRTTFILLLLAINSFCQPHNQKICGTYVSVKNGFERGSIMILNCNMTFLYKYGVGGCRGDVTGTWKIENNKIKFMNDIEFTEDYLNKQDTKIKINDTLSFDFGTPYYPDLSKIDWIIKTNYIKPVNKIETGCLTENSKHKRIKRRNAR